MKKNLITALALVLTLVLSFGCSKDKGPSDQCSTEPPLQISTTPANNSTEPPAPGPGFPVQVAITSTLPTSGVTIVVKARPENTQTTFFSQTKNSNTAGNDFVITNTPAGIPSIVEITVTSVGCSNNKVTASYRYSRK